VAFVEISGHPVSDGRYSFTAPQRSSGIAGRNGPAILKRLNESRQCIDRRQALGVPMWVLLLLPFVGLLWVPFYNFAEPSLFGFPFFYWYQLAWVPITALLIWLVYRSSTPDEAQ
jgi:hypothetical protein